MTINDIKEKFNNLIQNTTFRKYGVFFCLGILLTFLIGLTKEDKEPLTLQELAEKNRTASVFGIESDSEEISENQVKGVLEEMKSTFTEKERSLEQKDKERQAKLDQLLENYQKQQSEVFELKRQLEILSRGSANQFANPGTQAPATAQGIVQGESIPRPLDTSNSQLVYRQQTQIVTPEPISFDNDVIRTITQRKVTRVKESGVVEVMDAHSSTISGNTIKTVNDGSKNKAAPNNPRVNDTDNGEFTLAMGSIISGTLLNGVAAPTGVNASNSPIPVLLRVKREAIMPNNYVLDIRECHMLAEAAGSLADERVQLRAVGISCITNDGQALEKPITAYAVSDDDGMAGIRGTLVERSRDMVINTMVAGFFSGFSEAAAPNQVRSVNTTPSVDTLWETQNMNKFVGSGMMKGASDSLDRLAGYYMSMVEQMFPVIELTPGIQVDFIVQRGMTLNLDPQNKQEIANNQTPSQRQGM